MPFSPLDTAWNVLSALIVLVLPGAAWLVWIPGSKADLFERLADAVGISVALTALFGLAAFYADLQWLNEAALSWAALALLILFLVGLLLRLGRHPRRSSPPRRAAVVAGLLGLFALIGLILWRFYQARSLALPAWVDSVHHTLIVRIILERGGLPASLDPYIPAFFSYHYGFHLVDALFAAWSRTEPAQAMLWLGQVINALVALSVYRLGKTLWQDARPAAAAGLLVGFAFHMPAYYLTWGRYTLLTGLLLLPLAMAAAVQVSRQPARISDWLRLALLTAGVALSHYTALLLLGFFMILLLAFGLFRRNSGTAPEADAEIVLQDEPKPAPPSVKLALLDGLWQPASAALLGLLLAAPWLVRVWQQSRTLAGVQVISPLDSGQLGYWEYILYLLGPLNNEVLLGVAAAGLILAFFYRVSRLLAAWALLLALLTLPWGLRLDPWRPDHMAIVLFMPAGLLIGDLLHHLTALIGRLGSVWLRRGLQAVLALTVLALLGWGLQSSRDVLNPTTIFVDEADVEALDWVEKNTPVDARFLINTTPWMGSVYRGVDGGYWLLPLTGRQSVLPPVLYTNGSAEYVTGMDAWAERASQLTTCDEPFWSLVRETDASFLYTHEGQGGLQPAGLANCPDLVPVYRRSGVYIYEINK